MSDPEGERMDYELLKALRRGDKPVVETFFPRQDADNINVADEAGRRSCRGGVTEGGNSALHIAADFRHLELAELICARDSSLLRARNAALETPLHCAVRAGADQIVSILARRCEEEVLRATDREGKTALHAAAEEGRAAAARALMSADPGLAAILDNNDVSPLYAAVLSRSLELVQILIGSRADGGDRPEASYAGPNGQTALQAAAVITGSRADAGDRPEASYAGPNGQTALHAAVIIESPEIAKELLQWKSKIAERADNSGSTPLHYLATTSNTIMVRQLLEYNTFVAYHLDFEGLHSIHLAARMGRLGIIRELIKSCPDIYGSVDNKGRNFLHIAVAHERETIVEFVCQSPCLVKMMNARDCDGNTPLHLAVKSKNKAIVCFLLINRSVHPSIVNKDGRTPLDLAITWLDHESILQNAKLDL